MTMTNKKNVPGSRTDAGEDDDLSSCASEDEPMEETRVKDAQLESDDSDDESDDTDEEASDADEDGEDSPSVFIPGKTPLAKDEELVMDNSAYVLYQQATTTAPCLSFAVLRDNLGDNRADVFPLTAYIVAGTQAEQHEQNNLLCMKLWNMHRIDESRADGDSDEDDVNDEDPPQDGANKKPKLSVALVPHPGAVNRVRVQQLDNGKQICASWSESGSVYLTDITSAMEATEKSELLTRYVKNRLAPKPFFKFSGHKKEGFGLDWSPVVTGQLASGDCYRNIHVWRLADSGRWKVDDRPLMGHTASVEDLQWSPREPSVLASCSVDRSVRIFDIRANPAKACMLTAQEAHVSDVNVIAWNRVEQAFLLSGGDDGVINVWDLRQFKSGKPVSQFEHHEAPITSIEWHPTDSTVFAVSSEDDCVTLWDLAIERDVTDGCMKGADGDVCDDLPAQLLFIHQGQQEVKECHWHPQMPGILVSTAHSGFNIFRTISV
ncbi:glutamate-rich WD repeat-containing protein 1-like [Tropilaelaps mercedesae]|uniref:Glutamate-rich WD repeat-containing protein 1-like n=1 Tax=Tropilaelaps mercedesae TaxID=418985 RepID=A0A1V9XQ26_9ACAR|nr:glutamate-rich WD repeat-containing protein 1-like [Tropilaelaps mercedesae]